MSEALTRSEVAELAAAFPTPDAAARLLEEAGLPRSRQPAWQARTAEEFWTEVAALLAFGALEEGRQRLLAEARLQYPANTAFDDRPGPTADNSSRPPAAATSSRRGGMPPRRGLLVASILAVVTAASAVVWRSLADDRAAVPRVTGFAVHDDGVVAGQTRGVVSGTGADTTIPASELAVTLTNRGPTPALITKIEVRLLWAQRLETCLGFGAGVETSARYSVVVPTALEAAELGGRNELATPASRFVDGRDLPFEVRPNANDAFDLTIGPGNYIDFRGPPWIYVAEIYLHVDGEGSPLFVGSAAVSAPLLAGFDEYTNTRIMGGEEVECARRNLERLTAATRFRARGTPAVSKQITLFRDELSYELAQVGRTYAACGIHEGTSLSVIAAGAVGCDEAVSTVSRYLKIPDDRLEGVLGAHADGDWYCIRPNGVGIDNNIRCANQQTQSVIRLVTP